jgi:hypothetical protein
VWSVWGLALALVLVALATIELAARARGFEPSIKDTPALWSAYRERARTPVGIAAPLVVIGSSRFMLGIDANAMSTTMGRAVINLAIDGSSPMPILEDLARDASFRGTVLCEIYTFSKDGPDTEKANSKPIEYLHYFHSRTAMSDIEARLRERLQSHLVLALPELSLRQIVNGLFMRNLGIRPSYLRMVPGRYRPADYTRIDLAEHRRHWLEAYSHLDPPLTDVEVLAFADKVSGWVDQIRSRGGDVVFLRMVSSFGVRTIEDAQTPRSQWNLFASRVHGTALHYQDVIALRDFVAADGSHLDRTVAGPFTRALGETLLGLRAVSATRATKAP